MEQHEESPVCKSSAMSANALAVGGKVASPSQDVLAFDICWTQQRPSCVSGCVLCIKRDGRLMMNSEQNATIDKPRQTLQLKKTNQDPRVEQLTILPSDRLIVISS